MTLVRFRQRSENFERSFQLLSRAVAREQLNELERGGLIQFFEVAFELAWKCLGDYLENEGFTLTSPKQILRQAFQSGLIEGGRTSSTPGTHRLLGIRSVRGRNVARSGRHSGECGILVEESGVFSFSLRS
ncbi:nucleotidyltransferase substrate binding protein [Candidatus Peregrinibacteria bacterium]|nr:nucleotidyltransferase substrate binding protein [Candidatus Peregrinibacteria bacterium]MBI3816446.1 nucleotidyltransferase substrate binding protein [Candidatus Peregrinibacteria bacterium]